MRFFYYSSITGFTFQNDLNLDFNFGVFLEIAVLMVFSIYFVIKFFRNQRKTFDAAENNTRHFIRLDLGNS